MNGNLGGTELAGGCLERSSVGVGSPSVLGVAEGYQRWAPLYDQDPNPLIAREERALLPLLPALEGKCALDLACGTGRWLRNLLRQGARMAVGLDISGEMLRMASRKPELYGKVVQANCVRLPFREALFDFAICSFAIAHIGDLPALVNGLARVIRPGADLFVSDLHPEAYAQGWRTGFRDRGSAVRIEGSAHSAELVVSAFDGEFACLSRDYLRLGDPEKAIFAQAGRLHAFADACRVPAVLLLHFRRIS